MFWQPQWHSVEEAMLSEVIYPGELSWSSACSCCWVTPFTFGRISGGPVLHLHICAPLSVPCGPTAEGPACSEEDLPQVNQLEGLNMLQSHGPVLF